MKPEMILMRQYEEKSGFEDYIEVALSKRNTIVNGEYYSKNIPKGNVLLNQKGEVSRNLVYGIIAEAEIMAGMKEEKRAWGNFLYKGIKLLFDKTPLTRPIIFGLYSDGELDSRIFTNNGLESLAEKKFSILEEMQSRMDEIGYNFPRF